MTDLGTLGGSASWAWAISTRGQVVGGAYIDSLGDQHAFLYSDGSMVDLNSLIAPTLGWVLWDETAINDCGQIVWYGVNSVGGVDAYLLTLPRLPGDANLDGTVNGADLNIVLSNFDKTGMDWAQGDFLGNGTVNGADLNIVLSNFNQTLGASIGGVVPEPGTFGILVFGAVALSAGKAWRRKQRLI
jgi:probable HAF family extracellular repeat protein